MYMVKPLSYVIFSTCISQCVRRDVLADPPMNKSVIMAVDGIWHGNGGTLHEVDGCIGGDFVYELLPSMFRFCFLTHRIG